jgi:hypothetical protein
VGRDGGGRRWAQGRWSHGSQGARGRSGRGGGATSRTTAVAGASLRLRLTAPAATVAFVTASQLLHKCRTVLVCRRTCGRLTEGCSRSSALQLPPVQINRRFTLTVNDGCARKGLTAGGRAPWRAVSCRSSSLRYPNLSTGGALIRGLTAARLGKPKKTDRSGGRLSRARLPIALSDFPILRRAPYRSPVHYAASSAGSPHLIGVGA